jgi:hypothetical protein
MATSSSTATKADSTATAEPERTPKLIADELGALYDESEKYGVPMPQTKAMGLLVEFVRGVMAAAPTSSKAA